VAISFVKQRHAGFAKNIEDKSQHVPAALTPNH